MKAIILAGGGGTRLWPISRKQNPKQVEAVIGDRSLLRVTYDRVREGFRPGDIIVSTSESQRAMVTAQLPSEAKGRVIAEPCKRDTAAAIGFALLRAATESPEDTFVVINSDAYVRDVAEYHRVIALAGREAGEGLASAVLIGITPAYGETGYGYIKVGDCVSKRAAARKMDHVFAVERFVEKPDRATAEAYVAHGGYLWNPTLIVSRIDRFLGLYRTHLPRHAETFDAIAPLLGDPASCGRVHELFASLPSVSIDYGILEKEKRLLVIPAGFGWADVGNWRTVRDILAERPEENVVKGRHVGIDSSGNIIYTLSGKLVATAGVHGMVIIETADAILVCPQDRAHDVKKIVGELEANTEFARYL